jgi:hypothetical protein
MSKATSSTATDDRDASELPPEPEEVIAEHREVFETIAEDADDDEIADLFGRQPLAYLAAHGEEGDGDV